MTDDTPDLAALPRRRLIEQLVADGRLRDTDVRRAGGTVPREVFLGPAVYRASVPPGVTVWTPVRRDGTATEEWLRLAYEDTTWVTQLDGILAEHATGPVTGGTPTSSSTLPGLVLWMIEQAGVRRGHQVLIIGAGTGYSTACVCEIAGAANTTAIETDPNAAVRARRALAEAGHFPTLVTGDGLHGHAERAPYDVVVAFCSMRYVPYGLLRQVKPGGTLLVTLAGWGSGHGLTLLKVDASGGAEGRFLPGYTSFMTARPHDRPPHGPVELLPGEERPSRIDPSLLDDWTGRFVAQLAAPSAERLGLGDRQILLDVATGSQAWTRTDSSGAWTVVQRGPLRLWDAVEDAVDSWEEHGSPDLSAFQVSITPGAQRVRLGGPGGPGWDLPV
ncbi:ATP-grasp peptide maturase system methyltransferase [Streptomyces sp. NPDC101490]|uniref:ATP-grasp peptide maturase system methyltransferase n=1 Tax=Streptomyces sp. NPDC101490 TaxID=3366143 RepID=UPI00380E8B4E